MTIQDVRLIQLPKFLDSRGNLSFAQNNAEIPFEIQRTYWIFDVPGGESRGGHAFINNQEVIIALSGSFKVVVDDGADRQEFWLNRSYYGLYVPSGIWREISDFSTNSLALEFGSIKYDRGDYVEEYSQFLTMKSDGTL